LEERGRSIGPLDLLIAAQARSLGATLVTANAGEFKRVKGLKVKTWK
jgi:tRNA(fMet)-specific endonuclease VapC